MEREKRGKKLGEQDVSGMQVNKTNPCTWAQFYSIQVVQFNWATETNTKHKAMPLVQVLCTGKEIETSQGDNRNNKEKAQVTGKNLS